MAKYGISDVRDRLKAYIQYIGISVSQFQKNAGVSNSFVASIDQSIAPKTQTKISTAFPDLNMGWLLTGEGEMLRSTPSVHQTMTESPGSVQIAHNSAERININNQKQGKSMESSEFMQKLVDRLMGSNEALVANNTELSRTNARLAEELATIRSTLEQQAAKMREMESALGCMQAHSASAEQEVKSVD